MVFHLRPNLELLLGLTLQVAVNFFGLADGLVITGTIVVVLLLTGLAFKLEPFEISARRKTRVSRSEIVNVTAAGTLIAGFSPRDNAGFAEDSFASPASLCLPSDVLANQTLIQIVETPT